MVVNFVCLSGDVTELTECFTFASLFLLIMGIFYQTATVACPLVEYNKTDYNDVYLVRKGNVGHVYFAALFAFTN